MGSGVIIGVVDSGITPNHASFMDDGTMPPKPPTWKGSCRFRNKTLCNNKLIGAIAFRGSRRPSPKDAKNDGHGTHVASIALEVLLITPMFLGLPGHRIEHSHLKAHLAIYKACSTSDLRVMRDIVAAIEEAIKNGVDILSLSLGQQSLPFYDDDMMIATLSAIRAKIFVCMAAGNSGPYRKSVENGAPWILTVGASTHDRRVSATVKLGNGVEVEGESGYQPSTFNATGNIIFPGFGEGKYRDMSVNVKAAGGVGMIVLDTSREGATTLSYDYVLPTAHVNYTTARKIVNYLRNTSSAATATIAFNGTKFGARPSPTVGFFSSRGPHPYNGGIIKPRYPWTGVNILSAWPLDSDQIRMVLRAHIFNFDDGTSMATPHLAGIAALLKNIHKNWSTATIKSAIMTTANRFDLDGNPILDDYKEHINHANAIDMGSGTRYNDTQVSTVAGSLVQCSIVGSIAPEDLNYPSISISLDPSKTKSINRTLTNVGDANEVYNIDVEEPKGITVVVSPSSIQFSQIGEEKNITLEFSSKGMPLNQGNILDGQLQLDSGKHFIRSPISVTIL
ncbi:subtilisin-like protease 4 [Dioscorea cayenensis subsp. rotundata]|uniref:Subtilisin-like protease 4 n=1 Tax=Dioscorea cayennensis subsp. rotundata TaxID=55577 RepID=A0AB40CD41_DIOCR|nr:subtilisin-like protease 4 [Dioscorea cayenensis subsp. rotundata]